MRHLDPPLRGPDWVGSGNPYAATNSGFTLMP